jgi:hypothetical protein
MRLATVNLLENGECEGGQLLEPALDLEGYSDAMEEESKIQEKGKK